MERYGHGTPDDWMERNVYTPQLGVGPVADGRGQHRAVRPGSRHADPAHADRLDSVLGRGRDQRHRPLLRLSQLRRRGREHQHRALGHPDRRRGAAQQPPRVRRLGQALVEVVRVRHRLDVHPHARVARPGHGEEAGAQAALRAAQGRGRPRHAARGDRQPLRRAVALRQVAAVAPTRTSSSGCVTGRRAMPRCCARSSARCCAARRLPAASARGSPRR